MKPYCQYCKYYKPLYCTYHRITTSAFCTCDNSELADSEQLKARRDTAVIEIPGGE